MYFQPNVADSGFSMEGSEALVGGRGSKLLISYDVLVVLTW